MSQKKIKLIPFNNLNNNIEGSNLSNYDINGSIEQGHLNYHNNYAKYDFDELYVDEEDNFDNINNNKNTNNF